MISKMKNPAGQGQGYETGRGGDPINRMKNMAENDIYVKLCCIFARLVNALFMPLCNNASASLASSFLPNQKTQLWRAK